MLSVNWPSSTPRALKNGSLPMTSATFICVKDLNAVAKSSISLARRTLSLSPSTLAASWISCDTGLATGLGGLTSKPTPVAVGNISRMSLRRFGWASTLICLAPVILPLGFLMLETRPSWTGSALAVKTVGVARFAALAATAAGVLIAAITAHLALDQIVYECRQERN